LLKRKKGGAKMLYDEYTIKLHLKAEEVTTLLAAVNGYKMVVSPRSKEILDEVGNCIKFQVRSQNREKDKKVFAIGKNF
jgi:hypothetical protein